MSRMNAQLDAVVSIAHPITHVTTVPLSDCLTYPLIFADKSMRIRHILAEAFDASGQDVTPAFETNSIAAMKSIATGSDGIAFLSRFDILEGRREGKLTYIPIRDGAFGRNTLSLVLRQKRTWAGLVDVRRRDAPRAWRVDRLKRRRATSSPP
jgi:DNA-binding transcriptional LysR family regulator